MTATLPVSCQVREIIRAHFGLTQAPANETTFGHFATDAQDRRDITARLWAELGIAVDTAQMGSRCTVGGFLALLPAPSSAREWLDAYRAKQAKRRIRRAA